MDFRKNGGAPYDNDGDADEDLHDCYDLLQGTHTGCLKKTEFSRNQLWQI